MAWGGDDEYEVIGKAHRELPVYLISGPGNNTYKVDKARKVRIYAYESDRKRLKDIAGVRKIISDNPAILIMTTKKVKYKESDFTPWGFYDSDVGFSLGAFFTYTMYGFKQSPFTFRHRIGYNYLRGFMYQGTFPFYDERKSFNLDAFIASPVISSTSSAMEIIRKVLKTKIKHIIVSLFDSIRCFRLSVWK